MLYNAANAALWSSETNGRGGRTEMQSDGNLVIYSSSNKAVFDTGTASNPGASLVVQDDGNLVVYSRSRQPLWDRHMTIGKLRPGHSLAGDEFVRSPNARFRLIMQSDGNLVLYQGTRALWSTATNGKGERAVMQADGNLVVVDSANKPVWNSRTGGNSGGWLAVQDDGNMVVYSTGNKPLWSTNTHA